MGKVHFLRWHNYYACIRAVGNGVLGLATKNKDLVTCKNCIRVVGIPVWEEVPWSPELPEIEVDKDLEWVF